MAFCFKIRSEYCDNISGQHSKTYFKVVKIPLLGRLSPPALCYVKTSGQQSNPNYVTAVKWTNHHSSPYQLRRMKRHTPLGQLTILILFWVNLPIVRSRYSAVQSRAEKILFRTTLTCNRSRKITVHPMYCYTKFFQRIHPRCSLGSGFICSDFCYRITPKLDTC